MVLPHGMCTLCDSREQRGHRQVNNNQKINIMFLYNMSYINSISRLYMK